MKHIKDILSLLIPLVVIIVVLFFFLHPRPIIDTGPNNNFYPHHRGLSLDGIEPDHIIDPNDL